MRDLQYMMIAATVTLAVAPGCGDSAADAQIGNAAPVDRAILIPAPGSPVLIAARAMAAGDLNGDGCDDLVLCTATAIQVFLGGAQRPWQKDPDVTTELPAMCSEIALADVDRDAKLDVVLADHDSYAVSVLLGAGDGRFRVAASSPFIARSGKQPHTHGLAIADVNQDGHLDIVTANNSDGDISLLLGDGRGKFFGAPKSPFPCGRSPYPIAVADINGDKHPDVLIPNATHDQQSQAPSLTILLGNARGELTAAPGSPLTCEATLWYVAAGDLNDDHRPDVVATHSEGGTGVTVLLNRGQGTLTPAPSSPLQLGHGSWGVEIADMNRDGKADLVVAADESIRVLLGDGRGGFQSAAGSPFKTGKGAWRLVVADFNGDGKPDVATRCVEANRLEILYGN